MAHVIVCDGCKAEFELTIELLFDKSWGGDLDSPLCPECKAGGEVRDALGGDILVKRVHEFGREIPIPPRPILRAREPDAFTASFDEMARVADPSTVLDRPTFEGMKPRKTGGRTPRNPTQGPRGGKAAMVIMARAKACHECGDANDSTVMRTPNGMFQHYRDCLDCREGGDVREGLKGPSATLTPVKRTKRKKGPKTPPVFDKKAFAHRKRQEFNLKIYGKRTKHPMVIFGPNDPDAVYYETPAPVSDWRSRLRARSED